MSSINNPNEELIDTIVKRFELNYSPVSSHIGQTKKGVNDSIIAVIGAGMSYDNKVLLATDGVKDIEKNMILENVLEQFSNGMTAQDIDKHLKGKHLISEADYTQALDALKQITQIPEGDFETQMAALCQGSGMEDAVRKELVRLYNARHNVMISYEVIAKLFRHDVINAIINFNFDEILDNAIEENLRREDYELIISDGDYHPNSSKKPYIKPHGTVGHPSTMRFSKEDYTRVPSGIQQSIREQLEGDVGFIIAGFGMQSIEFNEIIESRMKQRKPGKKRFEPTFYFINPNPDTIKMPEEMQKRKNLSKS
jgi:hypothetical protein